MIANDRRIQTICKLTNILYSHSFYLILVPGSWKRACFALFLYTKPFNVNICTVKSEFSFHIYSLRPVLNCIVEMLSQKCQIFDLQKFTYTWACVLKEIFEKFLNPLMIEIHIFNTHITLNVLVHSKYENSSNITSKKLCTKWELKVLWWNCRERSA